MPNRDLSPEKLRALYAEYLDALVRLGLEHLEITPGTGEWVDLMRGNEMNINPAFSSGINSEVSESTSLCLTGYVGERAVLGVCTRLYPRVDKFQWFAESGRMWGAPHQVVDPALAGIMPEGAESITGNLCQIGGLFIEKGAIAPGGGPYLARMARIASLLAWEVDHFIGLLSSTNYAKFPAGNAGANPVGIIAKDLAIGCPPTDFWLTWAEGEDRLILNGYEDD